LKTGKGEAVMSWKKFARIKLLALDFDGVLTDGFVYCGEDGYEMVRCNRKDGLGINMLQKNGLKVIVISKETSPVVSARCRKMNIECWQGVDTGDGKLAVLKRYAEQRQLLPGEICFVGDDVNDLACMKWVGIGVTVADGHPENKKIAAYITKKSGGSGAVREVCDIIMQARKK